MASTPNGTTTCLLQSNARTYGSHVITIVVGTGEGLGTFNVHSTPLSQMTTFFENHEVPEEMTEVVLEKKKTSQSSEVKTEHIDRESTADTLLEEAPKPTTITCHYHLSKIQCAEFEILVNFLYNTKPRVPTKIEDARTLIRAYILAVRYDIEALQNVIVDRFREFHTQVDFHIDIFAYLIGRLGRSGDGGEDQSIGDNLLVRYFIEQIAFDIAVRGYDEFQEHNEFVRWFIMEHTRPLRLELFKALANHAHQTKRLWDPAAVQGCLFHVHDGGSVCSAGIDD